MFILTRRIKQLGKSKYIQGEFYSKKNKEKFPYKSSYELAYLEQLELNDGVVKYIYEPFELYYTDDLNNQRIYRPDFMVLFEDGSIEIVEIKPKAMLRDFNVQAKALACRNYLEEYYKDMDITYKFITEKDLFNSDREYQDFIKSIKG